LVSCSSGLRLELDLSTPPPDDPVGSIRATVLAQLAAMPPETEEEKEERLMKKLNLDEYLVVGGSRDCSEPGTYH
jgi:hypothetical protein